MSRGRQAGVPGVSLHLAAQMALQTQARGLRPFSGPGACRKGQLLPSLSASCRCRALRRLAVRSRFSRGLVSRPCVCEHVIKSVRFLCAQTRVHGLSWLLRPSVAKSGSSMWCLFRERWEKEGSSSGSRAHMPQFRATCPSLCLRFLNSKVWPIFLKWLQRALEKLPWFPVCRAPATVRSGDIQGLFST